MERYGYIRVSAKDQNPERQFLAMQEQKIKQKKANIEGVKGHVKEIIILLNDRNKKCNILVSEP